jgi:hypothetical protein
MNLLKRAQELESYVTDRESKAYGFQLMERIRKADETGEDVADLLIKLYERNTNNVTTEKRKHAPYKRF